MIRTAACSALFAMAMAMAMAGAGPSDRTSSGAETVGNASGTIPAWTGGLATTVSGWTTEKGYADPFAGERRLFEVNGANASAQGDRLSPGLRSVLARNPAFRMPVYPSHRTAAFRAARRPVPFPEPRNGIEAISNHLLRDLGGGVERSFDTFVVRSDGKSLRIGFHDRRVDDENIEPRTPGRLFSYIGWFTAPPELVGTIYLVHEPDPLSTGSRKAWIYNEGQRRVRRAPDLAYDNVQNGSDGLAVVDQYDGYNGRPDMYDWQLVGKREMLVPYNNYAIGDRQVPYSQIVRKGSPNPDYLRFELHRVWIVDATLKKGLSHVYARRMFYLDEDSWSVVLSEAWDGRGQLWRVGVHSLLSYHDVPVPWYRFELWFDLTNDSYVLAGLDNESTQRWTFGTRARLQDFRPDALRRAGH